MRRVLLIADLEGITGVDALPDLVFCGRGYPAAARRMSEEVALVARLLRERGVQAVRISDAHRAGRDASNLDASLLPEGCEVRVEEDMYGGPLLDDVDAVCCVGMHASGLSPGFGAHTVSVHTAWRLGERALTETHVAQYLAAERGLPLWFSAGDQVLEAEVAPLPFARTKVSSGVGAARSRPPAEVEAAFRRCVTAPPGRSAPVPDGPLVVRFQRRDDAEAARAAGATLTSPTEMTLAPAATFTAQYEEALRLIAATDEVLAARVEGLPGTQAFAQSAAALLLASWE